MLTGFKKYFYLLFLFGGMFFAFQAKALVCETDTMHAGLQCRSADLKSWNKGTATTAGCNVETVCPTDPNGVFTLSCTTNTCSLGCNSNYTVCTGGTNGTFCKQDPTPVSPCDEMDTCSNTCTSCIPGKSLCDGTCTTNTRTSGVPNCSAYNQCGVGQPCTACSSGVLCQARATSTSSTPGQEACVPVQSCPLGQTFDACSATCTGTIFSLKLDYDSGGINGGTTIKQSYLSSSIFNISGSSRIGIGTNNPVTSSLMTINAGSGSGLNMSLGIISNLSDPVLNQDAATKAYVDSVIPTIVTPIIASSSIWQLLGNNTYYNNGNVGIGTNNPWAKLDVQNLTSSTTPALSLLGGGTYGSGYQVSWGNYSKLSQNSSGVNFITWGAYNNGSSWTRTYTGGVSGLVNLAIGNGSYFSIQTDTQSSPNSPSWTDVLTVNGTNVGIGTTAPGSYKLNVNGGAYFGNNTVNVAGSNGGFVGDGFGYYSAETVFNNSYSIKWSSTSDKFGSKDLGLRRNAAGVLEIYDGGTAGNYRDIKLRNIFASSNVTIGTTTPGSYPLDILSSSQTYAMSIRNSSNGYAPSSILLNSVDGRGQGVYMADTPANKIWYAGVPYSAGQNYYMIGYQGTINQNTAQLNYSLFTINNVGNVGIGTTTLNFKMNFLSGSDKMIDAGGGRVGSLSDPVTSTDAATKAYVDDLLGNVGVTSIQLTSTSINGSLASSTYVGYDAGNKICSASYSGSHFCRTDEIVYLVQKNGAGIFNTIDGENAWIADGPPGYTGVISADDCGGWTNSTNTKLGHFWIFASSGGGRGSLSSCDTLKKLACCK